MLAFVVACLFVAGGLLAGAEGVVNRRAFEAARHENGMLKRRQVALRGQMLLLAGELKTLEDNLFANRIETDGEYP